MLNTDKTFEQYTTRMICLSALSEGNRYSNPSDDQKYVKSMHAHIGLYYYGELDDEHKVKVLDKIKSDWNAIQDVNLKETVRLLLED